MPPEQRPRSPFDEQAALAELERLQRAIEESRRQRKDAVARFDHFVASFQTPPAVAEPPVPSTSSGQQAPSAGPGRAMLTRTAARGPSNLPPGEPVLPKGPTPSLAHEPPAPAPQTTDMPAAAAAPPIAAPPQARAMFDGAPGERPPIPEAFVVPDVPAAAEGDARSRRLPIVPIAAIAVLAIAAIVLLLRPWRSTDQPPAGQPPAPAAVTAPPAASTPTPAPDRPAEPAPAAAPSPGSATASLPGIHGELTTVRTAWVRVTLDGERAFERELPPSSRIPLRAERTIAVRVGDAGAVRLTIDGRDLGFLGDEGEVVTRTFTARPREPR